MPVGINVEGFNTVACMDAAPVSDGSACKCEKDTCF